MIASNKGLLSNLRPVATSPLVFIVFVFIINNAWFPSLLFTSDRLYQVLAYCLMSLILLLNSKLSFSKRSAMIVGPVFSFYFVLGLINNSFITGFVLAVSFWVNCFVVDCSIRKLGYDDVVKLCETLVAGQFIFLFLVDFIAWRIKGRGFPSLIETIAPVSVFGIFLLGFLRKDKRNVARFYFVSFLCLLYFSVSIFEDWRLHFEKFQIIQFGLIAFVMLYSCLLYLFRVRLSKGRFFILTPLSCLLLIAILTAVKFTDVVDTLVSVQPSSGYLRFAVNTAMLRDLSDVSLIFGKGFGSSWKLFGVTDLHPDAFMFEFDSMYPHSGLVVLLYEYGILGLAAFGILIIKHLLFWRHDLKGSYKDSIGSRLFASWLWLGLLLFFLMQNALYVQGIPSGDMYFQSNVILFLVLAWLIIKARTKSAQFRGDASNDQGLAIRYRDHASVQGEPLHEA